MARGRESDHASMESHRSISRERDRSPVRGIPDVSESENINSRMYPSGLGSDFKREDLEDNYSRWGNSSGMKIGKMGYGQSSSPVPGHPPAPPPGLGRGSTPGPSGVPESEGERVMRGRDSWGPRGGYSTSNREQPPPRSDRFYNTYYRSESKSRDPDDLRYGGDYYSSRDYYLRQGSGSGGNYYGRGGTEVGEGPTGGGGSGSGPSHPPPPSRSHNHSSQWYSSASSASASSGPTHLPEPPLDPLDPSRPNDVEIVVPNKAQRGYAESIEGQLKRRMGLLVDLLFPPPDISPSRVISDLAARRCLYVIFATSENEKYNSLTLNILHGEPQEHRNMPVEDALRLMERDFEDYLKQKRLSHSRQVVPRDVRNLLLDLLEARPLSMGDLDTLIKYLRERQNALVDDQIEQKREIAGSQTSSSSPSVVAAGGMAVTYPGYNYLASTVSGANHNTPPQGVLPPGGGAGAPPAQQQQPTSLSIVSSPNAAATIAAYPPSAYSSISATAAGMIGAAYGVSTPLTPQQQQPPQQIMQSTAQIVSGGGGGHPQGPPPPPGPPPSQGASKQADLQERILNLMKGQSAGGPGGGSQGLSIPSGVPAPTGVPPPSVVPAPRFMPQQQQQMWGLPPQGGRGSESGEELSSHGNQQPYNPWNQ